MENFRELVTSKEDSELLKMVYEFDQWSPEMLEAIKNELIERKILPTDLQEKMNAFVESEDLKLSKGNDLNPVWLIIGWIGSFGLFGIAVGYHYTYSKRYSSITNKKYFVYNEQSRKKGQLLLISSIILSALNILYRLN